jgi:glucose-6-phosphate isomerase
MSLARERGVGDLMQRMFSGEAINSTENRAVLHTALRDTQVTMLDGRDLMVEIQATLKRMRGFSDDVRSGKMVGHGGKPFTDIIHIGIGGSHLGPALAVRALIPYASPALRVHFVSNIDGAALHRTLAPLDAAATLVIVASKTFTTIETMVNARSVRDWMERSLGADAAGSQLVAVTANTQLAREFGIAEDRIFPFWDWVGGRYSLWSAVGLPVALAVGIDRFQEMLEGAHEMDQHFRNAPFEQSMPVILAMIGIWYNNFLGRRPRTRSFVRRLARPAARVPAANWTWSRAARASTRDGQTVDYDTGAVIWGAPGTDASIRFFSCCTRLAAPYRRISSRHASHIHVHRPAP